MFKGSKLQMKIATLLVEVISVLAMAVVAIAVVFTFFFRTVSVDGNSMNPTLNDGDRLLITNGVKDAEYGDIIVASQPNPLEKTLIKRVIATEGQQVNIDFEKGIVYVDGVELSESYIADPTTLSEGLQFPVTVPEGCVFVMGDNRLHSTDSRSPLIGFIEQDYIMGKVIVRIMPSLDFKVDEF